MVPYLFIIKRTKINKKLVNSKELENQNDQKNKLRDQNKQKISYGTKIKTKITWRTKKCILPLINKNLQTHDSSLKLTVNQSLPYLDCYQSTQP